MKGQSSPRHSTAHSVLLFVYTERAAPIVTERKKYDILYDKREGLTNGVLLSKDMIILSLHYQLHNDICTVSLNSVVDIFTALWARRPRYCGSVLGRTTVFICFKRADVCSGTQLTSSSMKTGRFSYRFKAMRRKANHSHHLVSRTRMCGALHPLLPTF
jgi:hypothetical protein